MQKEKDRSFVSIKRASEITGIEQQTLRKLGDKQVIKSYKTPSGQRRFCKKSLEELCNSQNAILDAPESKRINFLYARVSTKKQMDDLHRQIEYMSTYRPEYAEFVLVSDIGSGINFKRKGLKNLLDSCLQGTIGEVVVAHRDRLSRFAFELIELLIIEAGGKITVLDNDNNKSSEQELAEDLLSIVHIYSCRQMGRRSYKRKSDTIQAVSEPSPTDNNRQMDTC